MDFNAVKAIVFGLSAIYRGVLIYGLKQKWRWVTDPPEWMFAFYFPAMVKVRYGPKSVEASAYINAWLHFIVGLVCFIPPFVDFILSRV